LEAIKLTDYPHFFFCIIAHVAYRFSCHRIVFMLDMAVIILFVGSTAGRDQMIFFKITKKMGINKGRVIIIPSGRQKF
jgi:hypothetical protein